MATLPTGTLTFLFTDIEGSTQLLHRLGDEYGALVSQQRRVLREVVGGHGGTEVDAQGDGFFFTFPRARDGLAAAVAAQHRLASERWPDDCEPKVRMGLHTGEPVVSDEGYVGLDVVRAARIATAAHGGQILVSETTRSLVASSLPPEIRLRDVGEHRLKDMTAPERLFQAEAPGLPAEFDVPRAEQPEPAGEAFSKRVDSYVKKQLEDALRSVELD